MGRASPPRPSKFKPDPPRSRSDLIVVSSHMNSTIAATGMDMGRSVNTAGVSGRSFSRCWTGEASSRDMAVGSMALDGEAKGAAANNDDAPLPPPLLLLLLILLLPPPPLLLLLLPSASGLAQDSANPYLLAS